jgi:tRNA(fMet)-specific endonuclease VapC
MILLDTDTLSLLFAAHPRVAERFRQETDDVAPTVVSRIEILEGRFASVLKAADGEQLLRAQQWLQQSEGSLATVAIIPIDAATAAEFDKLRANKKLRKIGRADLLIASMALARRARLVTHNLRHFQQVPGLSVENWAD